MSRESLTSYRYFCDGCDSTVVADQAPYGWMGLRAQGKHGRTPHDVYLLLVTGASDLNRRQYVPDDSWWCSLACLERWLRSRWESANREDAK